MPLSPISYLLSPISYLLSPISYLLSPIRAMASQQVQNGTMKHVWVVGSANLDLVFRTAKFPKPGETLLGGPFASYPGGKGGNQAVAVGRLSGNVNFVGCVGMDSFGDSLARSLAESGVKTDHLAHHRTSVTGTAAILVDDEGRNEIVVAPGANWEVTASQVELALKNAGQDPVLVQLEIPMEAVMAAASSSTQLFLDPAPARLLSPELLARTFVITPNEVETEALTGIQPADIGSCRMAAGSLLDRGVEHVVIKLGEKGCFWMSATSEALVPAPSVKPIDTVAAGDVFNGGLAWFYASRRNWKNALELANYAAALSVTKAGAQSSMPTLEELRAFARDVF